VLETRRRAAFQRFGRATHSSLAALIMLPVVAFAIVSGARSR